MYWTAASRRGRSLREGNIQNEPVFSSFLFLEGPSSLRGLGLEPKWGTLVHSGQRAGLGVCAAEATGICGARHQEGGNCRAERPLRLRGLPLGFLAESCLADTRARTPSSLVWCGTEHSAGRCGFSRPATGSKPC